MHFWDKERTQSFQGHIHIGPTSQTHCCSCNGGKHPLEKGLAVHFRDRSGNTLFQTGPNCFKKHTDIPMSQIPVFGFGFADITLKPRGPNTNPPQLSPVYKLAAQGLDARQERAYANVQLRADVLPRLGFRLMQDRLKNYLSAGFPYSAAVLEQIEVYVDHGVRRFNRPSLDQLFRAQYVACQIDALKVKNLRCHERDFVDDIDADLKRLCGLTDRQMVKLEQTAARHQIMLDQVGIRFPENQVRFERAQKRNVNGQLGWQ